MVSIFIFILPDEHLIGIEMLSFSINLWFGVSVQPFQINMKKLIVQAVAKTYCFYILYNTTRFGFWSNSISEWLFSDFNCAAKAELLRCRLDVQKINIDINVIVVIVGKTCKMD